MSSKVRDVAIVSTVLLTVGVRVSRRGRPDCGVGELTDVYSDGTCRVVVPGNQFTGIPISEIFSVEEALKEEAHRVEIEELSSVRQTKAREAIEAKRRELFEELRSRLNLNFLKAQDFYSVSCAEVFSCDEFEAEKISFVKSWMAKNVPRDKDGQRRLPDDEQARAITTVKGHIQVVARAGSGKTTTLVYRALFLMKHCHIAPSEMLLLAFNRKAALEIRRRLLALLNDGADVAVADYINRRTRQDSKRRIVEDEVEASAIDAIAAELGVVLPHVMTFHALAYAIAHPAESLLTNGSDGQAQNLSKVVQQVVDDHLQISGFKEQIRGLMLAHFREDWDRIVQGGYGKNKEDFLRIRRSLPRESLGGEHVKSYGEKVVADFLFEHDVAYKYERNHWWDGINYRPDFTIFKNTAKGKESGVIIEYFGLKGDPAYDQMSEDKRNYWKSKKNWILIEISPIDIGDGGGDLFLVHLKEHLESQGISCIRLSEDEIWHRVRGRAIDRFTTAIAGFIGRCRKQSWSPADLEGLIESYSPLSSVEGMFLKLAHRLYVAYLDRLSATGEDDFDGLMQRAASAISGGQTLFQRKSGNGDLAAARYVCIDEFQDFSDLFYRLLSAIRKQNSKIELFCVGDDWQAINGFAGSNLRFFENFEDHFGASRRLQISTNYRSSTAIVAVGNALMNGLGKPAVAHKKSSGMVLVSDLNGFEPSLIEKQRHPGDIITPAVLRLASKALAEGLDVAILNRTNRLNWYVERLEAKQLDGFLESIRSHFPKGLKERINISTAHKFKGLEKPMVIVLDAVASSYPLIHPDWVFSRILGDSPEKIIDEERRLLYVALTRAEETLVILTDGRSKSPFLKELEHRRPLCAINWADYPPHGGLASSRLLVNISDQWNGPSGRGTYPIKDLLQAGRYSWHAARRCWEKSFPLDGFRVGVLQLENWGAHADGVEVRVLGSTDTLIAHYRIDAGQWHVVVDELDRLPDPSPLNLSRVSPASVA